MKKLISLLGIFTISTATISTISACGSSNTGLNNYHIEKVKGVDPTSSIINSFSILLSKKSNILLKEVFLASTKSIYLIDTNKSKESAVVYPPWKENQRFLPADKITYFQKSVDNNLFIRTDNNTTPLFVLTASDEYKKLITFTFPNQYNKILNLYTLQSNNQNDSSNIPSFTILELQNTDATKPNGYFNLKIDNSGGTPTIVLAPITIPQKINLNNINISQIFYTDFNNNPLVWLITNNGLFYSLYTKDTKISDIKFSQVTGSSTYLVNSICYWPNTKFLVIGASNGIFYIDTNPSLSNWKSEQLPIEGHGKSNDFNIKGLVYNNLLSSLILNTESKGVIYLKQDGPLYEVSNMEGLTIGTKINFMSANTSQDACYIGIDNGTGFFINNFQNRFFFATSNLEYDALNFAEANLEDIYVGTRANGEYLIYE